MRRRTISLFVMLTLLSSLTFYEVAGYNYVGYDDFVLILDNAPIRDGIGLAGLRWAFSTLHFGNWMPATWLSHLLDVEFFGLDPSGHHVTNLALHTLNVGLLFLVLRRMTGAPWRSFFVAALFSVHPLHVEPVAWLASRRDLLSSFFGLLSLAAYGRYAKKPGLKGYLTVLLCYLLGLMSKPALVTLPLALLALDFWPLNRYPADGLFRDGRKRPGHLSRVLAEKLPLLLLAGGFSLITYAAQNKLGALQTIARYTFSLPERIGHVFSSALAYVMAAVFPHDLAVFYPPGHLTFPFSSPVASSLIIGALTICAVCAKNSRPALFTGWFWYLITLFPVSGIIQLGEQTRADRFVYLPILGLFIVFAWVLPGPAPKGRWRNVFRILLPVAAVAACVRVSKTQLPHWQNGLTLFTHAATVTRNNYVAHFQLGIYYKVTGDLNKAADRFREVLRIVPEYSSAHHMLGMILLERGNRGEGLHSLREAVTLDAHNHRAAYDLGVAFLSEENYEEALHYLSLAISEKPDYPGAMAMLEFARRMKAERSRAP